MNKMVAYKFIRPGSMSIFSCFEETTFYGCLQRTKAKSLSNKRPHLNFKKGPFLNWFKPRASFFDLDKVSL
jgi:hypothetical protein